MMLKNLLKNASTLRKLSRWKRPLTAFYKSTENDMTQVERNVDAVAYAEAFNLAKILENAKLNMNYQITVVDDVVDTAIHLTSRSMPLCKTESDKFQELFVFSDGVVVFWDIKPIEQNQILDYLQDYQISPYSHQISFEETEKIPFQVIKKGKTCFKKNLILLQSGESYLNSNNINSRLDLINETKSSASVLERYSFSHALATSVKIGVWENQLSKQAEPLSEIANALTNGKILWKRKETLKKIGEFSRLRHSINMTELLNQDFYWERDELERLYFSLCKYLTVNHRLNMMNKRLDYCQQLVHVIDNTLTHKHASTLEWMIIILIVVEILFDSWHFMDSLKIKRSQGVMTKSY